MKLLLQPDDGVRPLVKAISSATRNINIMIFRFDQREVERALAHAVTRGVTVNALIAHTNQAGEEALRRLELRLLAAGVTVARTADDLIRYHAKLMIVDHRELHLLAFNWTHADIERSRSFGVVTRNRKLVQEAERLFEADCKRQAYEPGPGNLLVSPLNARKRLAEFLKGARKSLLIYDPKISDPAMLGILAERSRAGVEVRVLGRVTRKMAGVSARKLAGRRLHTRTIIRDGTMAFVGSQSLRALELDERREVGLIFRDPKIVSRIAQTFAADWTATEAVAAQEAEETPTVKVARKVAKLVARELPDVSSVLNGAVKEVVGDTVQVEFSPDEVESAVRGAVKEAVKEVVSDIVQQVVEDKEERGA